MRQAIEEIFRGLQQELGWTGHRHWRRGKLLAHLALGLVAYALLSGRMPWDEGATELRVLATKMSGQLVPLDAAHAGLPAHVGSAVTKMLSVTTGERFGTCGGFVGALQAAPVAAPGKVARNVFNDGNYPDAESHQWEAGAGAGRWQCR
mgnify:CR=1 FL=1